MKPLTITCIQANLQWQNSAANVQLFELKIRAVAKHTQVIVLPEMFTTGFTMNANLVAETMQGSTIQWLQALSTELNIIITGSMIIAENETFYNRLVWVLPNGQIAQYNKRHLFAYAGEDKVFAAGTKRLITQANGWKINLQVCYDLRFPIWARQSNTVDDAPEYDLLINVANWPAKRISTWTTLLCARAIENQCYVIGVNRVGKDANDILYNGGSIIIDPLGIIVYQKFDEEDVYTHTLLPNSLLEVRNQFPFLKDKDSFKLL